MLFRGFPSLWTVPSSLTIPSSSILVAQTRRKVLLCRARFPSGESKKLEVKREMVGGGEDPRQIRQWEPWSLASNKGLTFYGYSFRLLRFTLESVSLRSSTSFCFSLPLSPIHLIGKNFLLDLKIFNSTIRFTSEHWRNITVWFITLNLTRMMMTSPIPSNTL